MPSIWTIIAYAIAMLAGGALLSGISNIVGSATGHNPMAQISSTMMQTIMPFIVTVMPVALMMNMMMSVINSIFTPITRMATALAPTQPMVMY
ncbi:MAG: hypothetical protein RMI45_08705 [Ignisphaera sp.]|nr:hypothetical protein [Ignisphaera sp.]